LEKTLIFVDTDTDVSNFNTSQLGLSQLTVFSFNVHTHKLLEEEGIQHEIGESYLSEEDHYKIFDKTVSYWEWFKNNPAFHELELENVNLLSVLDTAELHQVIIRELYIFLAMKRIIEKTKPEKIITSNHFSNMLKPLIAKNNIEIKTQLRSNHEFLVPWNQFLMRFNIGKTPISISISRGTYDKFRNFLESIIGKTLGLWLDIKNRKKMILFIEFDPSQHSDLIHNISKNQDNLLFVNRRRPAIWNFKSISLLRKNRCKIASPLQFLTRKEKKQAETLSLTFSQKLEKIWNAETQSLSNIFSIENFTFWPSISEVLLQIYKSRMLEYVLLVKFSKKLLEKIDFGSIVSLNTMGETEKTILNTNKNKISTVLLEHGASDYLPEISRYDVTSGYRNFEDKISVWSEYQKKYLMESRKIPENRIFVVGSPRHDTFFNDEKLEKKHSQKTILIVLPAIAEMNFLSDTQTYIRLEKLLMKIFVAVRNMDDVNLIIKLHPVQDSNNEYIKKLIQKLDPKIPIYQIGSIKKIIESCDVMINIHVELMPSTVLLEGLILKKPIINITMLDKFLEFQYAKDDAVLSISDQSDLIKPINDLLHNKELSEKLIHNGQNHVRKFLANPGNASKSLADALNSL
jgi:glycosyltransferase involved in cell wall biosynthesis